MEFTLDKIWNFTLFVVDQQPVTIGNVLIAICVALIVLKTTRFVRLRIRDYLSRHSRISPEGLFFIDKLLFIFDVLIASILVLQILHIPITELTVLGSALAIGLGFAAKDIISNTMSGVVILLEKAIEVGDVVQIEGKIGTVTSIGIRSTVIHNVENLDIILPNSHILENEVINWTMQDSRILTHIEVGIAYNTDVHHATDVMLQALTKLEFVLREPQPFVLFADFGDGALIFQVYFAIEISNRLQRLQKESKVRYQLFDDFKKAEIVIAFPQRDTHLDTSKPLDLRILRESEN